MIKLEIVSGSLQISNGGSIILVAPKNSCAIDVLALYDAIPFVVIYNKYLGNSTVVFNQPLANCEDSTGTPFTVNTFIDFAEAELGFDTAGGGGGCSPFKYNVNSTGIEPCLGSNNASGYSSTIGGGSTNVASGIHSTIGGGDSVNASGNHSTIGGGRSNSASGAYSTVGGGCSNIASCTYSTVGGGQGNIASELNSTIGGGRGNTANGLRSTIGGGYSNIASGLYSSVLGGRYNNTNNYNNAMIIGSEITANRACTTFVNDLSVCSMSSGDGCSVKVNADGLFVSCNLSGATHSLIKPSVGTSAFTSLNSSNLSTLAGIANKLTVIPYIPAQTITSASLYINVTTLIAGSNARILIYSNLDGKPDTKIYESANLDCSTTGVKTATTVQTFVAGQTYWIGVQTSSTQTLTAISIIQLMPLYISTITTVSSLFITPTFGSAPSSFGVGTGQNLSVQFVGITL